VEFSDPKKQLAFQIKGSRVTLSHRDLGYGVSMVLPILVALHSSEFDLITMEQPELHIHPQQQAELGDELIATALRPIDPKQLIIETHSEHLLLRIMRRMRQTAEGNLPDGCPPVLPKDVALLFVSPESQGSLVQEIGLNERGALIKAWPGGFFEEGFNETFD
jgi:predicted ATPase